MFPRLKDTYCSFFFTFCFVLGIADTHIHAPRTPLPSRLPRNFEQVPCTLQSVPAGYHFQYSSVSKDTVFLL